MVAYSGSGVRAVHIPAGKSVKELKPLLDAALDDANSVLVVTDGSDKADIEALIRARGPSCYGGVAKPSQHAVGPHTQNFVLVIAPFVPPPS